MVEILHRTAGLLAVNKPAGVTVIPGRAEDQGPSLSQQLEQALGQKLWVVHRLDRDTSGALLFALDAATHRTLSMAFEAGRVEKRYLALAGGDVVEPLDLDVPLAPARRGRMRPARPGEDGAKTAKTLIRPLQRFGGRATLVEAVPLTGRTHQIRVHLLHAGHPLIFDHQYGHKTPLTQADLGGTGDEVVLGRTPLHAASLRFLGLSGVPDLEVSAPMPEDLGRAVTILGG